MANIYWVFLMGHHYAKYISLFYPYCHTVESYLILSLYVRKWGLRKAKGFIKVSKLGLNQIDISTQVYLFYHIGMAT